MFFKIDVLKNYSIFTGKHLCWSLILIKLQACKACPKSNSQGRPLNVRLGRPLDIISGRSRDARSGRPLDGQIRSLGDILGTLEGDVLGTSWGPIFAGWAVSFSNLLIVGLCHSSSSCWFSETTPKLIPFPL